jgi:hypothetical protein
MKAELFFRNIVSDNLREPFIIIKKKIGTLTFFINCKILKSPLTCPI